MRAAAVAWLSGELTQRQIGVGWAALRDRPLPAAEPSLEVDEIEATFTRIGGLSGQGSQAARRAAVAPGGPPRGSPPPPDPLQAPRGPPRAQLRDHVEVY